MTKYTAEQITTAIEAEVRAWAEFFNIEATQENLEARRMVMRANVNQGYFAPLSEFLPSDREVEWDEVVRKDAHDTHVEVHLFEAGEVVSMREYAKRLPRRP